MNAKIYRLSKSGRDVSWTEWKKHKGCSLSDLGEALVSKTLGPSSKWSRKGVSLGDIEKADSGSGRDLAKFIVNEWNRLDLVEEDGVCCVSHVSSLTSLKQ